MALQGTLDTFALPDVLRLLASTKKTGRLRLSGARGSGSVWVDGGGVVGSDATGAPNARSAVDVLFELLRYKDGSFTFEADSVASDPLPAEEVEPLLVEAEQLLFEWRDIEAVVPSLDAWIALAAELPRADVVVDAGRWRIVAAVGGGTTVRRLADALGLSEVPVCRAVKDLVELGLTAVAEAAPVQEAPPAAGAFEQPFPSARAELDALASSFGTEADGLEAPDVALPPLESYARPAERPLPAPLMTEAEVAMTAAPVAVAPVADPAPAPVAAFAEAPADDDEVSRQLANLSPKAARAVAAAAQAVTDEERDAALAEVTGEDDEPINRGLLLKFLSSVRS